MPLVQLDRARDALPRAASAAVAAAGAGVGFTVAQLRNGHLLAKDEIYQQLKNEPLAGEPLYSVSADGTELYAEVHGDPGSPTVVLIPGWVEAIGFFDLLTRLLLSDGYRVVCCDLRGQGKSQRAARCDQRIERYGEDLEAQLAAVRALDPAAPPLILAGHSLGAMSIAAWAETHAIDDRVQGVVLINTGMVDLMPTSNFIPRLPARVRATVGSRLFLELTQPLMKASQPTTRALLRYGAFGPDASPGMIEFVEAMVFATPPRIRAGAGKTLATLDLAAAIASLTVPTVVIAGDADKMTPVVHAERMAAELPDLAELLVLPRVGHMAPLENPGQIADAINRLAARLDA